MYKSTHAWDRFFQRCCAALLKCSPVRLHVFLFALYFLLGWLRSEAHQAGLGYVHSTYSEGGLFRINCFLSVILGGVWPSAHFHSLEFDHWRYLRTLLGTLYGLHLMAITYSATTFLHNKGVGDLRTSEDDLANSWYLQYVAWETVFSLPLHWKFLGEWTTLKEWVNDPHPWMSVQTCKWVCSFRVFHLRASWVVKRHYWLSNLTWSS